VPDFNTATLVLPGAQPHRRRGRGRLHAGGRAGCLGRGSSSVSGALAAGPWWTGFSKFEDVRAAFARLAEGPMGKVLVADILGAPAKWLTLIDVDSARVLLEAAPEGVEKALQLEHLLLGGQPHILQLLAGAAGNARVGGRIGEQADWGWLGGRWVISSIIWRS